MLLLPMDDLLAITRELSNVGFFKSGLDRCLRRHGASNLTGIAVAAPLMMKDTSGWKAVGIGRAIFWWLRPEI